MIMSTAVSKVVVISQLKLLVLFYQKILCFFLHDIKKIISTIYLIEYLNTKIPA